MQLFSLLGKVVNSQVDLSPIGIPVLKWKKQQPVVDFTIIVDSRPPKINQYEDNQTNVNADYGYFYKAEVALFEFFEGHTLKISPLSNKFDLDFLRILLNYPLASLMYQLDFFILHASAVEIFNKVYLFAGNTQQGKSTIAAYLIKKGGKLITEDSALMKLSSEGFHIYPSYPLVKISDQANTYVDFHQVTGVKFSSDRNKRRGYFVSSHSFCDSPRTVDFCIFPEWNNGIKVMEKLSFTKALPRLMGASLSIYPLTRKKEARLLKDNIQFFRRVDLFRYSRKKSFSSLDYIIDDLKGTHW